MAYDEDLADRIRGSLGETSHVTEKRMFGGLAFLVNGNMAVAASGQGGLMLRVDPEQTEDLLAEEHTGPMEMRGREMAGGSGSGLTVSSPTKSSSGGSTSVSRRAGSLPPK